MKETTSRRLILVGLPEDFRKRVRDALGLRGNAFHVLPTLRDALEMVRQTEPSIVATNANLPDGNGYDLCRQIKEINKLSHVGVIMIVENSASYDHALGILSGIDRFIEMQMEEEPLAEAILEVAEKMEQAVPIASRPTSVAKKVISEIPTPPPEPAKPAPPPPPSKPAPERSKTTARMMPKTSDPLRAFFDDEEPPAGAARSDAASNATTQPALDAVTSDLWIKRSEKVSEASSAEISRHIEQWIEFHYGQRVDENMRQEVSRVLKQHIQTIIQNTIRKLMEE
ncbi:MAG: response regulator [Myxococcales bacterium]|nr:response regulator [Myxococcales bacterium]